MGVIFIKAIEKVLSHWEKNLNSHEVWSYEVLDDWGAVESRWLWRSADVIWLMVGPGETEGEVMSSVQSSV